MQRCLRGAISALTMASIATLIVVYDPAAAQAPIQLAQTKKTSPAKKPSKVKKTEPAPKPANAWRFSRGEAGLPTLRYGPPTRTDDVITFVCLSDMQLMRVVSFIGSRGVAPGNGAPIKLSNGKRRFEIAGTAFTTETTGEVDIGGATRIDPSLFAVLRGGETLLVEVPGRTRGIPVTGIGGNVDAFEKACVGRSS